MALVGVEGLAVIVVLVVIFLWGPQKLSEIARSIGLAKRGFEKAAKEGASLTGQTPSLLSTPATETVAQDPVIVAAKALGIVTEGKTKEELTKGLLRRSIK